MPKMKELSEEELLKWLDTSLNRYATLQISHPHLAYYPTKKDKQAHQQIRKAIQFCFKYGDGKLKVTWDKQSKAVKELMSVNTVIEIINRMPADERIKFYDTFCKGHYKPKVSKEFVEKWVEIIRPETPTTIRIAIKDMLQEAGVEVEND